MLVAEIELSAATTAGDVVAAARQHSGFVEASTTRAAELVRRQADIAESMGGTSAAELEALRLRAADSVMLQLRDPETSLSVTALYVPKQPLHLNINSLDEADEREDVLMRVAAELAGPLGGHVRVRTLE